MPCGSFVKLLYHCEPMPTTPTAPKYRQVFDTLLQDIRGGRLRGGDRLPSEAELEKRFGTSRITVGRAVRELQLAGLVDRRAGSGTYVRAGEPAGASRLFGVIAPEMGETEIFDPILRSMTSSPGMPSYALIYGSVDAEDVSKEARALELCRQYIERRVAGVVFAPIELTPLALGVNRQVVEQFERARIPVVLLDRAVEPYPARSRHDVIGIDNRRAGYIMAAHLLAAGCRRLAFLGLPNAASTVEARISGTGRRFFWPATGPRRRWSCGRIPATSTASRRSCATSAPTGSCARTTARPPS